jgi:putative ATP-binding cassette transporter
MISGLWQPSNGLIERPETGDLLFIPQKPYMLLGSLREQLCYPTEEEKFSDEQLNSVLAEVKLQSLIERYPDLDIKQDWPRILSLGEQQRLAFGRLLLNAPRFAVLDEATSALDVKTEEYLYELLQKRDLAVISVGHRPTLIEFHQNVLELVGDGSWRLLPTTSYDFDRS